MVWKTKLGLSYLCFLCYLLSLESTMNVESSMKNCFDLKVSFLFVFADGLPSRKICTFSLANELWKVPLPLRYLSSWSVYRGSNSAGTTQYLLTLITALTDLLVLGHCKTWESPESLYFGVLNSNIIIVVVVLPRILCKMLNFGLTSAFYQLSENIYENFKLIGCLSWKNLKMFSNEIRTLSSIFSAEFVYHFEGH